MNHWRYALNNQLCAMAIAGNLSFPLGCRRILFALLVRAPQPGQPNEAFWSICVGSDLALPIVALRGQRADISARGRLAGVRLPQL